MDYTQMLKSDLEQHSVIIYLQLYLNYNQRIHHKKKVLEVLKLRMKLFRI